MKACLSLLAIVSLIFSTGESAAQIIRTAPDIETPRGYQPGTGVDRNGIKSRGPRRPVPTFTIPQGGYYYGWSPGRYYYYSDNYYYDDYYVCPYCGNRWCNGFCRYRGPIYLPPIAGDAGQVFGPRAVKEFLGVDQQNAGGPVAGPLRAAAAQAPAVPPPLSNPTARAQAWKFVEYGDRHFKKGNYRRAVERYEKAESQAGDIAEIYFRQAFAELGLENYADAVTAMHNGLAIDSTWPDSGFVLEELYPTAEAKREVFRQLHQYVDEHPHNADAQYMLAVMQHFDGQEAAAETRFRRVEKLVGHAPHARAFLPTEVAQQPADEGEEVPAK